MRTTVTEKRVNTLMRIVNACFLPGNYNRLVDLNDNFKRHDFEQSCTANPMREFWVDISDTVNDGDDERVCCILRSGEGEDEHLHVTVSNGCLNLKDFNVTTYKSCKSNLSDLMKCRLNILRSKKTSGEHSNDSWTYFNRTHLTARKNTIMPGLPVYYLDMLCNENPDMDSAYTEQLEDHLKSDSANPLTEEEAKGAAVNKSTNKAKEEFLSAIEKNNTDMKVANEKAQSQRQELLELQKQELEKGQWSEYSTLSDKYLKMKSSRGNKVMIRNLAKRILQLESNIGADESVVDEEDNPSVL